MSFPATISRSPIGAARSGTIVWASFFRGERSRGGVDRRGCRQQRRLQGEHEKRLGGPRPAARLEDHDRKGGQDERSQDRAALAVLLDDLAPREHERLPHPRLSLMIARYA